MMEQKQLDEMDESFFGEEYIDDEESPDADFLDDLDEKGAAVNNNKTNVKKTGAVASTGKDNPFASALPEQNVKEKGKKAKEVRTEPKAFVKAEAQKEKVSEEVVITPVKASSKTASLTKTEYKTEFKQGSKMEPAKAEVKSSKTAKYIESAPPVDPWAEEKKGSKAKSDSNKSDSKSRYNSDSNKVGSATNLEAKKAANDNVVDSNCSTGSNGGLFKDASTWKALTGITIILLLFSVFTQGFQFTGKAISAGNSQLTLKEAETKLLDYVNSNLLQPPFVAQAVKSADVAGLYQVTLSVAGQTVDSYITKDGKLFFPQGLDTSANFGALAGSSSSGAANAAPVDSTVGPKPPEQKPASTTAPTTVTSEGTNAAGSSNEGKGSGEKESTETVEVTVKAKRWLFNPPVITVKKGSTIIFNIVPENVDFTFAVPKLGVQQEVKGTTKVRVVADAAGSYEFTCSSCEDWRGMKGTLMIE